MGCASTIESIETEMLLLRLQRTQIQEERALILKELEKIEGKKIIRAAIPDYLSHSKENKENVNQQKENINKENKNKKDIKIRRSKSLGKDKKSISNKDKKIYKNHSVKTKISESYYDSI